MVYVNNYLLGRIYVRLIIKCILLKIENKMKKKLECFSIFLLNDRFNCKKKIMKI